MNTFKEQNNQDLKTLQNLELEYLDILINICKKYNLRYYLIGGTLIGVLRHHGFIPWDDDIDVGLPRPDYNHFIKIAADELPHFMDIKTMTSDPNYKCYFTRLINNKKKIYWDHGQYKATIGVWTDVFPLDGLPDKLFMRKLHVFNVNLHKAIYKFSQMHYITTNKKRPVYGLIIVCGSNLAGGQQNSDCFLLAGRYLRELHTERKGGKCQHRLQIRSAQQSVRA